jgi:hypothetical protein
MARLKTVGFELNSLTAGTEITALYGATASISSTVKRSGSYALRLNGFASGVRTGVGIQFAAANSNGPFYFRFYFRVDTLPSAANQIVELLNTAVTQNFGFLKLNSSGTIELFNESAVSIGASSAITAGDGVWHRVEILFDRSTAAGSNVLEAKLDGTTFATSSTQTISGGIGLLRLGANTGGEAQTQGDWYYDDVAINDSTGSSQTGYPGAGSVIVLKPNAAGDANSFASQTGGTAGSTNNFTRVNEVTPDDATTFNGSATLNQEDMFECDDSGLSTADTINVVHVDLRFRNSTADTASTVKAQIKKVSGGTVTQSAGITPNSTTWKTGTTTTTVGHTLITYLDPDSNAWTRATLNTIQIGYKLTTGPASAGRRTDISKVWVTVDYTPGIATRRLFPGIVR